VEKFAPLRFCKSPTFKCSLDHAKRSLYRAVNGIFRRIGSTASEEVILELIKSKCLPILICGLEVCLLNKTNLRSLDFYTSLFTKQISQNNKTNEYFSANRFFMKLFNTSDIQTVTECQLIMTALHSRCGHYILILWFLLLLCSFFLAKSQRS